MDLTLEQLRALPDDTLGAGVYFLWKNDDLLYIGAARRVRDRLARQIQLRNQGRSCLTGKPQIQFNKYTVLGLPTVAETAAVEKALIEKWDPPENRRLFDSGYKWDHLCEDEVSR